MKKARFAMGACCLLLLVGVLAPPATAIPSLMVSMEDDYFSPAEVSGVVGLNDAEWHNVGLRFHSVVLDRGPKWFSQDLDEGQSGSVPLRYAGTFDYTCSYHVETMTGTLVVKPRTIQTSGPVGATFQIVLATVAPSDDGYAFDIQRRRNDGRWSAPKRDDGQMHSFKAKQRGRYDIRVRLVDPATDEASDWSPSVRVRAG